MKFIPQENIYKSRAMTQEDLYRKMFYTRYMLIGCLALSFRNLRLHDWAGREAIFNRSLEAFLAKSPNDILEDNFRRIRNVICDPHLFSKNYNRVMSAANFKDHNITIISCIVALCEFDIENIVFTIIVKEYAYLIERWYGNKFRESHRNALYGILNAVHGTYNKQGVLINR